MSERLDIFLKSITDYADTQSKKLQKTAETQMQKEIIAYKKQATESFRTNTNREISKIQSTAASKAADYESEKRYALSRLKNELSNSIFEDVTKKIEAFVISEEYPEFLEKSAQSIKEAIGEDIIFYLRADDMKYANILQSVCENAQVLQSNKIHLGGIFATDKTETLRADDTLDSRLKQEEKTFFENAEFKIS